MPTIAIVDCVRIVIDPKDHLPPNLQRIGGADFECDGDLLEGSLPRSKLRSVAECLAANREQVAYVWLEIRAKADRGGRIG